MVVPVLRFYFCFCTECWGGSQKQQRRTTCSFVGFVLFLLCFFAFFCAQLLHCSNYFILFAVGCILNMLFYSFFKTLVGKQVVVELKNNMCLSGTLHSVDQYLNVKLEGVAVAEGGADIYPQLVAVKNCFIRGSVVRYVRMSAGDVDTELLQDASRREASMQAQGA